VCTVNSKDHDLQISENLRIRLTNPFLKNKNLNENLQINAEIVGIAITKLKTGKSPGFDQIVTDHLVNAHPILIVVLSKLFLLMLKIGYVPTAFG
jgi:hypothetical protein